MLKSRRAEDTLAYFGLILATIFWAGNIIVARGVMDEIPPVALSFWRWFIAMALILPFTGKSIWAHRQTIRENWKYLLILAALSVGFFNTLLYLSAHTTDAANIGLINSSMPVMVGLLAWLALGVVPSRVKILGIFCALSGMLIIVSKGSFDRLFSLQLQVGDLFMVLAVLCWSVYSVLLKRYPISLTGLEFLSTQIVMGVLVIVPLYLTEFLLFGGFNFQPQHLPPILYVALFPGLLAYGLWNFGVQHLGPQSAAMSAYLVPVFVALLAWWLLNETPAAYHLYGAIFILGGVYMASWKRQT
jgi:drug/metabolite transporter (DMT)-like permease